jgi:hypothetical protein
MIFCRQKRDFQFNHHKCQTCIDSREGTSKMSLAQILLIIFNIREISSIWKKCFWCYNLTFLLSKLKIEKRLEYANMRRDVEEKALEKNVREIFLYLKGKFINIMMSVK